MATLKLFFFGDFRTFLADVPVTSFESSKVRALLVYLAVECRRSHTRSSLAGLFWPDWPQKSAMSNLRYALSDLRKNIRDQEAHPPFLLINRQSIQLNIESNVWVDVGEFERKAISYPLSTLSEQQSTIQDLQSAIDLYRREFLEGFSLSDCPEFEEWILAKREYYRGQVLQALHAMAEAYKQRGDNEAALIYARKQLGIEPWQEGAHQQVMHLLALSGQRVAALAQYEACQRTLNEELGVKPSTETTQLYIAIRDEQLGRVSPNWVQETLNLAGVSDAQKDTETPTLPTGTVTFLFSDIEGSVPLWERHPDAMKTAVARHHSILRQAIETSHGQVFQVIGDAFQAAFPLASQALTAAVLAQRMLQAESWEETGSLRVRMGLHTGPAELDEYGEYAVSHTLNRTARVMSAGCGGQILLSQEVADMVRRELPPGVSLKDLGQHRMKGMTLLEHLYQILTPDLPCDFPALNTEAQQPNNLPLQLTSFIGREKEISEVLALLRSTPGRLVTLIGAGGVGKTRLALQVASNLLESFPNGIWLVELAALADPERLPSVVAAALDVHETPGRAADVALTDYLRAKNLLLVLDNCEHLVAACADLAFQLLQASPGLHIMATSRERLGVQGETCFYVPSLSTPGVQEQLDQAAIHHYEAVRLFVERALSASPTFMLTEENALDVIRICQRLDGIPLAIELAAARSRLLSAGQIATRLDDVFHLLTSRSRTVLPRHQTLRALIDWSYDLLNTEEQDLLQWLSVFAGGWTLEAADKVCEAGDVLDLLGQLVDKSLVNTIKRRSGEQPRYRMLETIRQFAGEKLAEAGKVDRARQLHLKYYLGLVERIEPELRGCTQKTRLDKLEEELDNLRQAMSWALQAADPETELRLASAMMWFWHIRDRRLEGLEWLENGLAMDQSLGNLLISSPVRAKALAATGSHHTMEEKLPQAEDALSESIRIYRDFGAHEKTGLANALSWYGYCKYLLGEFTQAEASCQEALALSREMKDIFGIGERLLIISLVIEAGAPGDQGTIQILLEALDMLGQIGDLDGIATAYRFLGWNSYNAHQLEKAKAWWEQSLAYYQQVGNLEAVSGLLGYLGNAAHILRDYPTAIEYLERAVAIQRNVGNPRSLAEAVEFLGGVNLFQGNYELAGNCLEEALTLRQKKGNSTSIAWNHLALGRLAWAKGDREMANRKLAESFSARKESNSPGLVSNLMFFQSILAQNSNDRREAEVGLILSAQNALKYKEMASLSISLDGLGQLNVKQQPERSARLFGAAEHLYWDFPHFLTPVERERRDAALSHLKIALGEERMVELWAQGTAMTPEQAIAYALDEDDPLLQNADGAISKRQK